MALIHPLIRLLHVPFNTPYARKTKPAGTSVVNRTRNVPDLATVEWAVDSANLGGYDVCHVHFFELTPASTLRECAMRLKERGKRIVVTLHDVLPIHGCDPDAYAEKTRILVEAADAVVTLTGGAEKEVRRRSNGDPSMIRLPLGCVVDPLHPKWGTAARSQPPVRFAAFGSLRPNRRIDLLVRAFEDLSADVDATLQLLLRPIRTTTERELETVLGYESPRVSVRVQSEISDEEVVEFIVESSVLVLPYEWVCHSGQLELAFDMGVAVVAPSDGYLREQWLLSAPFVQPPTWFNWTTGQGAAERVAVLSCALRDAYAVTRFVRSDSRARETYRRYRQDELATHLETYGHIYAQFAGTHLC